MELWLDTIDFELIKRTTKQLLITGITTNPSILAKSSFPIKQTIDHLLNIQNGAVAVQITASSHIEMINQARSIAGYSPRIIIKVPVIREGLVAIKTLSAVGIKTMATAVFEINQVLLSALAGATYVAPYFSKIAEDRTTTLKDMLDLIKLYNFPLKLIAASIKNKAQIISLAKLGAHAITISAYPLNEFIEDLPATCESLRQFEEEWRISGKSLIY